MVDDMIGRHKSEIETPALLLYLDAVENNIAKMAKRFEGRPCKLRPHMKTHKLPLIAHRQMEAGAVGITCATLSEAKALLEAGVTKVLIANEVVGERKIEKLVHLAGFGDLIVCVDDYENAKAISEAAGRAARKVNVLVEVNVGLNRCGVDPGKPALEFLERIAGLKSLVFRGFMGYEGGLYIEDVEKKAATCRQSNRVLVETKELAERRGYPVEIVSAGGSNTSGLTGLYPGITDIQVGSYVTMDAHNSHYGLDFEQAVTVLATVISRPQKNRAVIDAGKKSLSTDEGLPICTTPGITISKLNEEHGHLGIDRLDHGLRAGDKIEIVPSHGCTTIPLYDRYVAIRNDHVESVLEIHAWN